MNSNVDADIEAFLAGRVFAVAGASGDRHKYGNLVLRCYWQRSRVAYPVNPRRSAIEGVACYPTVRAVPEPVHGLSLVTQPETSVQVVQEALDCNVRHFWFQPGAEHPRALALARAADSVVIAGGPCVLVVLRYDASAD